MHTLPERDWDALQQKVGYTFENRDLLTKAFIHRSYINENRDCPINHNERLEFLGDAVLELVVTRNLFDNYENAEGELTNWRAALVNTKMLAQIAHNLDFDDYLFLSRGEQQGSMKARESILADSVEAFIGATYLDQGYKQARDFIISNIVDKYLGEILEKRLYIDAKTRFQEAAQEKKAVTPVYSVLKEWGPDHQKEFEIGVYLDDEMIAAGKGFSKQEAETAAAEGALEKLEW